ncbi:MAG: zinc-dependent alcohol dehydrogenase family protein [Desulfobacterales bacterium]|nr:zinc-dependent alcohol dehydrogenase family protein [Desulfobacterales bacterium]MDX2513119.1 zinc-dependent alcohol dehydrogenase family protein [Desulfobacterales bacterium]
MKAMILENIGSVLENRTPLTLVEMTPPLPRGDDLLIKVSACGVCHTELDEIEGRTPPPTLPMIPGHQVVGRVHALGPDAHGYKPGERVGVAWIFSACGACHFCNEGYENLCADFKATGRDAHGGYAEYMTISEKFVYRIPDIFSDMEAAPLLCAGAIGYRSLHLTHLVNGQCLGLTGFGASAHLVMKLASHLYPDTGIYVFARSENEQAFARELGAVWAGNTHDTSPVKLDAIIDTTPAWKPVVEALGNLAAGGRLVINAIRKESSDRKYLLKLDYPSHLWLEKEIKSVANVTRQDVEAFLALAADMRIKPETQEFALVEANQALVELKERKIRGAKVLVMD